MPRRRASRTPASCGRTRRSRSWRCPTRRRAADAGRGAARAADAHRLQRRARSAGRPPRSATMVRRGVSRTRRSRIRSTRSGRGSSTRGRPTWTTRAARADWGFRPAYDFERAFREYLIPTIGTLLPLMTSVTAFAPATVSNVACGFDVLGFALDEPGDEVTATLAPARRVRSTTSPATAGGCRARRRATPPASRCWRCSTQARRAARRRADDPQGAAAVERSRRQRGQRRGRGRRGRRAARRARVARDADACALEGERLGAGSAHADNIAPCDLRRVRAGAPRRTRPTSSGCRCRPG